MPRPKKDGERVSLFLEREMMTRLRKYADEKGQTLTTAMERLITAKLNEIEAGENDPPAIDGPITICGGIESPTRFRDIHED